MLTRGQRVLIAKAIKDSKLTNTQIAIKAELSIANVAKLATLSYKGGFTTSTLAKIFPVIGITMIIKKVSKT